MYHFIILILIFFLNIIYITKYIIYGYNMDADADYTTVTIKILGTPVQIT